MATTEIYTNILSQEAMTKHLKFLAHQGYINFLDLPDDFDHITFLQNFGDFVPQYDGQVIWPIKAEPQFEELYHSRNTKPLWPHTECYEFDGIPPKYVALWSVKPADCGGGQTTYSDGYAFIASLTDGEREQLATRVYKFHSSSGIQVSNQGSTAHHPVYDPYTYPEEPIIRFASICMDDGGDPFMIDIRHRFIEFFERNYEMFTYKKNSLVIWDNWRMLHARKGFKDATRHINRIWISKKM